MVQIPGFPAEIATIPPAPFSPDDPNAEEKRAAWRRWRYKVIVYRTERHMEIARNPDLIPFEILRCSQHPAYWAAMWLRVFEPRWRADSTVPLPGDLEADDPDADHMEGSKRILIPEMPGIVTRNLRLLSQTHGEAYDPTVEPIFGYVPFIPFADQVRVMNELLWTLEQTDEHADAVWSKSRGWGASWILCLLGLWGWTFSHHWPGAPPWNILYLSRKEEYVDSKQQKSLFWKIRRLMRDLPVWQMPEGFNPDLHDQKGIISNPFNGNQLGGESTNTNAGRGDRVTAAVIDEAAAIPALTGKYSTLNETTDHRWLSSTESFQEGTDFYDLQHDDQNEFKPWRIETDFWENPLNDAAWLTRTEKRYGMDRAAFMQEVYRKPFSGSTWVYPWASNLVYDATLKPTSGYLSFIGVDPGFRDPTALVAVQESGHGNPIVLDSYQQAGKVCDFFVPLLKPSLFTDMDPDWRDRSHISWTSPIDATMTFEYQERELSFARTVDAMGIPRCIGDTYGEINVGNANDSVYDRWRKYGIKINTDRKTGEALTKTVKKTRTFTGRQKAMDELSRRWQFADTPGARMCGNAWKNSKFKPVSERAGQSEPMEPEHDSSSHLRTAGEYLAVYFKHRNAVAGRDISEPIYTRIGGGMITQMGSGRNGLRTLPNLKGVAD